MTLFAKRATCNQCWWNVPRLA